MKRALVAVVCFVLWGNQSQAFTGVQTGVPVASLTGWSLCYSDLYNNGSTSLATILSACSKSNLLLACRPVGSPTLDVAAHAPRADVIFDTGTSNTPHDANGVGWYYNDSYSWGFAPQGDAIQRGSCDIIASSFTGPGPDPDKRLCWHTGGGNINGGWRCGTADSLNGDTTFERLVFHTDTLSCGDGVLDFGEQCDDGNTTPGDGCDAVCQIEPCYTCSGSPSTCSTLPDASACDDGLFCNGTDTCASGACTVHVGDPCTGGLECNNVCNEAANNCAVAANTACADDGIGCTDDQCDGAGACMHPNNFAPCDDGLFCNGQDFCSGGSCDLHQGDPCLFSSECNTVCNEMSDMCTPTMVGTPCSDDGTVCTNDQCDGAGACAHPPVASGLPCPSDGNECTNDQCNGAGVCGHPPVANTVPCTDDGNDCTDDKCNGAGACGHPARMNGTTCNDGNACTHTDQCQSGICVGASPMACQPQQCRAAGICDPDSGTCSSCPAGYAQGNGGCTKTYAMNTSALDNLNSFCDGTGVNLYNGCNGSPFGFHWTDTANASVGAVTRVDVQLEAGVDCTTNTHAVTLNAANIGSYQGSGDCGCIPVHAPHLLANVASGSYVKGGANAVAITPFSCTGLSRDSGGSYAVVTVTYQAPTLPYAIRSGCRAAAKSKLTYKSNADDTKDKLKWKWGKGPGTTAAEFGDPTASTQYQLCVYATTSGAPTLLFDATVPGSSSLWSTVGTNGYKYNDVAAGAEGASRILLRAGADAKPKILIKGKGTGLTDPTLPLAMGTTGVRVQLNNESNGLCWESDFPLNNVTADDHSIKAKAP